MPIYIIEHLEPKVWRWCLIEYKNIFKLIGKKHLWFTNIKRKNKKLKKLGKIFEQSVSQLNLKDACILDPKSKKILSPNEAKKFKYFIFGGILGDYPPKKRTKKQLTRFMKRVKARNLGKNQLSTDNAVYVVKKIRSGKKLSQLKFQDKLEIQLNKIESIILPYRYVLIGKNKLPFISKELLRYLKRKRGF